eukprot:376554-Pelagomonas_calceolata.AAC.2
MQRIIEAAWGSPLLRDVRLASSCGTAGTSTWKGRYIADAIMDASTTQNSPTSSNPLNRTLVKRILRFMHQHEGFLIPQAPVYTSCTLQYNSCVLSLSLPKAKCHKEREENN